MIALFIDADNFASPTLINEALLVLEKAEGPIAVRRAYGSAEKLKGLADTLRAWAIRPFANLQLAKNTTDMSLAIDAMEIACSSPRPSVFAIASGDSDFVPLVVRLRERGIRMICVTEIGKMAQDAVPAYDEVIYVKARREGTREAITDMPAPYIAISTGSLQAAIKEEAPKDALSVPADRKAVVAKAKIKKASPNLGVAGPPVTVAKILEAAENLEAGEWQHLADVAKILHDHKLLAKSASSTKLFSKFPHHFELSPSKQPHRVRYIPSPL